MKFPKVLFLVLLMGVVACEGTIELGENSVIPSGSSSNVTEGDAKSDAPASGPNGAALFQQHCSSCHGADATGGVSYPATIVGYTPIEPVVLNGQGAMPAIPLAAPEIAAIQSFLLAGQQSTQPAPTPTITENSSGQEVYAAECAQCHGTEGAGTAAGPPIQLRDEGLTRFTVRQGRNGPGNPTTMPVYDHSAVTDAQLDQIIDWLDAFPNPDTGEGLYARYCSTCHGADGTGGTSFKPVAGTLRAYTIIREGHGDGKFAERSEYMPSWTPEQISDEEIVLIEQFMRAM